MLFRYVCSAHATACVSLKTQRTVSVNTLCVYRWRKPHTRAASAKPMSRTKREFHNADFICASDESARRRIGPACTGQTSSPAHPGWARVNFRLTTPIRLVLLGLASRVPGCLKGPGRQPSASRAAVPRPAQSDGSRCGSRRHDVPAMAKTRPATACAFARAPRCEPQRWGSPELLALWPQVLERHRP